MALHVLAPAAYAKAVHPRQFWRSFGILMLTMLVDLDHLLASPILDPNRCSIGFHVLHSWPAIAVYAAALLHPKTRLVAAGLLIHMALDLADCWWMGGGCCG
jgi:hypothetical protein